MRLPVAAPALATLLVLSASIIAGPAHANLLTNGGFESPVAGPSYGSLVSGPGFSYLANGGSTTSNGWTWSGNAGVINGTTATPWFAVSPPTGYLDSQYGFVQVVGSSVSQSFTLATQSLVTISWLATGRPTFGAVTGVASYTVTAGSLSLNASTTSGTPFAAYGLSGLLDAGTHTLTFLHTGPDATDRSFFLDDVTVTASAYVPEPASAAIIIMGLAGMIGLRRLTPAGSRRNA